jgi:hypothetical protein
MSAAFRFGGGWSVGEDGFYGRSHDCLDGGVFVEGELEQFAFHGFGDADGEKNDFFGIWFLLGGWHRRSLPNVRTG